MGQYLLLTQCTPELGRGSYAAMRRRQHARKERSFAALRGVGAVIARQPRAGEFASTVYEVRGALAVIRAAEVICRRYRGLFAAELRWE